MTRLLSLPDELLRHVHVFLTPKHFCALKDAGAAFRCANTLLCEATRAMMPDYTQCCSLHSQVHDRLDVLDGETYEMHGVCIRGATSAYDPRTFCLRHDFCRARPLTRVPAKNTRDGWRTRTGTLFLGSALLPVAYSGVGFVEAPRLEDLRAGLKAVTQGARERHAHLHCEFSSWVQLTHFSDLLQLVGICIQRHSVHVTRTPAQTLQVHWVPLQDSYVFS